MFDKLRKTMYSIVPKGRHLEYILAARRGYREGLRASAIRYLVWSRVFESSPIPVEMCHKDQSVEVHLMCYWRDYLLAFWALKSFYRFSGATYPLVIHINGFATRAMLRAFTSHFPGSRIIEQEDADRIVQPLLARRHLDQLSIHRITNVFVRKLIDFQLLSQAPKILILDSDVLFFHCPQEIVSSVKASSENLFLRDCAYCYTITEAAAARLFGVRLVPYLNAGLGLVQREQLRLEIIEESLKHEAVTQGDPTFLEQTLYAIGLSGRTNVGHLPQSYLLSKEVGLGFRGVIARHYAGESRSLITSEGINYLIETGFLKARGCLS